MIGTFVLLILAILGALASTGLFFFGLWHLLRSFSFAERLLELARILGLVRPDENPILRPSHFPFEASAVMNPAAVRIGNRFHLFYRAVGNDGVSRIGYASSKDGIQFDERLPYPVFALGTPTHTREHVAHTHAGLLASGGTWAGTEDPRAVILNDRLYLSFSAFAGWNSLRIGVVSIAVDDLLQKRWKWEGPYFLSPVGQVQKNWVLFPEKIHGKFAVLHSLHSGSRERVLIDYLDTLDADHDIHSPYQPSTDESVWDSTLRGAGPPPIKTEKGWLLLYHATDAREPHRYKIGAMLLDLLDPTKVIARAPVPVLAPDARYENEGAKSGVVYACGAVVAGDDLIVYYGGADSVICAAKTSLSKLLRTLTEKESLPVRVM